MAVEKMEFVNISGMLYDFDKVLREVVGKTQIHLENANEVFSNINGLSKFKGANIYEEPDNQIKEIYAYLDIEPKYDANKVEDIDIEKYSKRFDEITHTLKSSSNALEKMKFRLMEDTEISEELDYFIDYNIDMYSFFHLQTIKFRFGVMPRYSYDKLQTFLSDINALVIALKVTETQTHIIYFTDKQAEDEVDEIFKHLMFRRIRISDRVSGTPTVSKEKIEKEIEKLKSSIKTAETKIETYKKDIISELEILYSTVRYNYCVYSIREKVAKGDQTFHMTGFLPKNVVKEIKSLFENDKTTIVISIDPEDKNLPTVPTKLKNNPIFRPFETIVEMFSLPSYNELDPTPIVAIVYSLLFGIMFADVGQGALLAIGGFLLYKLKKTKFFGVVGSIGIVSIIFGFLFGSVFGSEDIIEPLLISPMKTPDNMTEILMVSIGLGFILLVISMILNLANAIRKHEVAELFTNKGMAGIVFYLSGGIISVLSIIKGHYVASLWVTLIFLVLPIVLMYLKEPLLNIIQKKKSKLDGTYFAESFFEIFESLLSYITNTMSFVRVGAFALNHIGMMSVVYVLAGAKLTAAHFIILVFGNALVMGLEGLIVGIQVLRLVFYELFSKFYTGGGKPYEPFKIN